MYICQVKLYARELSCWDVSCESKLLVLNTLRIRMGHTGRICFDQTG